MRRSISIDALDMSKSRHLMPNRTHITGSKNSWSVFRCVEVRSNPVCTGVAAIISPELAPPVGPFSQAIEVDGLLYFDLISTHLRFRSATIPADREQEHRE